MFSVPTLLAQWIEHAVSTRGVRGSNPLGGTQLRRPFNGSNSLLLVPCNQRQMGIDVRKVSSAPSNVETWTIAYAPELELDDWEPDHGLIRFRMFGPMEVDGIVSHKRSITHDGNTTISQPMFDFKGLSDDTRSGRLMNPADDDFDEWHWVFCEMLVPKGTKDCGRYECRADQRKKELGIG